MRGISPGPIAFTVISIVNVPRALIDPTQPNNMSAIKNSSFCQ